MLVEFRVARGWKAIGDMIGASERTARALHASGRLKVRWDDKTPILTSVDYQRQVDEMPATILSRAC